MIALDGHWIFPLIKIIGCKGNSICLPSVNLKAEIALRIVTDVGQELLKLCQGFSEYKDELIIIDQTGEQPGQLLKVVDVLNPPAPPFVERPA